MTDTGFNGPKLGETMPGTDDDGNLVNSQFLGTIKRFDNLNMLASSSIKTWLSHGPIYAVLLRNTSGGILERRRLAKCAQTVGYGLIENASGYGATIYDRPVVMIDPWLPATTGVADDYIFWGIIKGPAIGTLPASGSDIKASGSVGTPLVCSDDDSGCCTPVAADPGSSALAYQAATSVFGSSLAAFTSNDAADEITVLMHCPWFPC